MTDQGVNPLSNIIFENLKSPINPQVAQSSNAPTLEGIYSMVQENNSRLGILRVVWEILRVNCYFSGNNKHNSPRLYQL